MQEPIGAEAQEGLVGKKGVGRGGGLDCNLISSYGHYSSEILMEQVFCNMKVLRIKLNISFDSSPFEFILLIICTMVFVSFSNP